MSSQVTGHRSRPSRQTMNITELYALLLKDIWSPFASSHNKIRVGESDKEDRTHCSRLFHLVVDLLFATERDKYGEPARLDHWPETELVIKILALADPF